MNSTHVVDPNNSMDVTKKIKMETFENMVRGKSFVQKCVVVKFYGKKKRRTD